MYCTVEFFTVSEFGLNFSIKISSTSPPGGNLVDGLPPAASFQPRPPNSTFINSRHRLFMLTHVGDVALHLSYISESASHALLAGSQPGGSSLCCEHLVSSSWQMSII